MDNTPPSSHNPSPDAAPPPFVFLDKGGKRWPRLRLFLAVCSLVLIIGAVLFTRTLFLPSQLTLPPAVQQLKYRLKALQMQEHLTGTATTKPLWLKFAKTINARPPHSSRLAGQGIPNAAAPMGEIHLGFYEGWDPGSFDSLQAHGKNLTHLCPDWLDIEDGRGAIRATPEQKVLDLVRKQGILLVPFLRNMGETGTWFPEAAEGLINGPPARQEQFISALITQLQDLGAHGVVIDWEQVDPTYREAMSALLIKTASALHAASLEAWLCIPMGRELQVFDLDTLALHIDHFIAMLHDENSESDPPGPVASHEWFNGWLDTISAYGEPGQWVLALGSYGYDWSSGEAEAETIRFQDAMSRAERAALSTCMLDAPTANPHFTYEDSGIAHTIWFLDAVTFLNQLQAGRALHVGGIAISRLGLEDPGIWDVLQYDSLSPLAAGDLASLEVIRPGELIAHIGRGNFLTIAEERADGTRRVTYSEEAGSVGPAHAQYLKFPRYLTITHQGAGEKDATAITFDDGPDQRWTPRLLDILKDKGVSATFFMVGANMEQNPDIVQRIISEGHTIGAHTYTHPNIAQVSEERAYLEFNATQRLIEALTDRSTILFRPPYNADTNPHDPEELVPILLAQKLGYITATEDIDPEDWEQPEVATMLETVKRHRQQGGNIVLLHDAGGDRRQTIEALPQIIDYLRARGDTIVPLPSLLGITQDQAMPPVPAQEQRMTRAVSDGGFKFIHSATEFFWAFMIVATTLVILRTLLVACLAILNRRAETNKRPVHPPAPERFPPVSVLIAAYNEEKVIEQTLRSVLDSAYPGELELLVVDDGSRDQTAELVTAMADHDRRIRLLRQTNRGKAIALQNGLHATRHELVVTLDADTQFAPTTIGELVRPFTDPSVGAVSGRARVGNCRTLMARFQSLEYTCGFNLDRRAYHLLNCITVVPGAVSAFRKSAVRAAGGISAETLAEDTDLTLSLHQIGAKVPYASRAVAWTEAPETIPAFYKQRCRWAFGTLQCLWKHRDLLFNTRRAALGWFSLPSAWFFNILLVALGPIIDGILLFSLFVNPASPLLYFYFFIFLCADLLLTAVACLIEREPLSQVWLVLPMRFIYRPVLSLAVITAIVKASKGVLVGWGKLDRTASVSPGLNNRQQA